MNFKINIYVRFALIALLLVSGTLFTIFNSFWYALPFFLVLIFLVVGYFLLGTVQSAAEFMQTGQLDEANKRLDMTIKPNWLFVYNRAYFYLLKGTIAMQKGNNEGAETNFLLAESIGLPSENEKAMVNIYMAGMHAQKEKWSSAQTFYKKAQGFNITEPMLKDQMKQLDLAFKNKGQVKLARQMQMQNGGNMGFGGKRRRPPVR